MEVYGKAGFIKNAYNTIKDRFKTNKFAKYYRFENYVPDLNKFRFTLGIIGVVLCVATPIPGSALLGFFPLMWGLK